MTCDVRLEVMKALITKLPTLELMWPDALKDRWFSAFQRLLAEASKVEWQEPDRIAAAVDAQLAPIADELTAIGHKLAGDTT